MTAEDIRHAQIIDAFHKQTRFCANRGSGFTAAIIEAAARNIETRGALWPLVADFNEEPVKAALALRVSGALHNLVLSRRAGELARFYEAPEIVPPVSDIHAAMAPLFEPEAPLFADYIAGPPQTNEVGRAAALLFGFSEVAARTHKPLHLRETGSSAGLLMLWDQFSYDYGDLTWNTGGPVISCERRGVVSPNLKEPIDVASRRGCDLNPLDIRDPLVRRRAQSYIWPEQQSRLALFDKAAEIAARVPYIVDQSDALTWLGNALQARPAEGVTVIFHSVFALYLSRQEQKDFADAIESEGKKATAENPLAWLRFEPEDADDLFEFYVDLTLWPGGKTKRLARAHPHAAWVEPLDLLI